MGNTMVVSYLPNGERFAGKRREKVAVLGFLTGKPRKEQQQPRWLNGVAKGVLAAGTHGGGGIVSGGWVRSHGRRRRKVIGRRFQHNTHALFLFLSFFFFFFDKFPLV